MMQIVIEINQVSENCTKPCHNNLQNNSLSFRKNHSNFKNSEYIAIMILMFPIYRKSVQVKYFLQERAIM